MLFVSANTVVQPRDPAQMDVSDALLQSVISARGWAMDDDERALMRSTVREMFAFAFAQYRRCAAAYDELRPLTCQGFDNSLTGGHLLTLIDALDSLVVFAMYDDFRAALYELRALSFDKDVAVSVFEMNIRVVGGLLSAHALAIDPRLALTSSIPCADGNSSASERERARVCLYYDGFLLRKAEDLAARLLPAFDTLTGIPFGTVNLRRGVPSGETPVTSVAGAGTFVLEFGLLSRLTGNPVYEDVARGAMRGLFSRRSATGLVGNHINVMTGEWTHRDSGVGAGIDSYYEYMLKGSLLLGDMEYLNMFHQSVHAIRQHVYQDPYFVDVNMHTGAVTWPVANSLAAFWPGIMALSGDTYAATRALSAFHRVWRKFGAYPEGYNVQQHAPQHGQKGYPLRPELIESTYVLYRATGDSRWQAHGRDYVQALQAVARAPYGFAAIADVETRQQRNAMDSFFLSETLKYLYLLFDDDNFVNEGFGEYVFNTEGHPFPLSLAIAHASNGSSLAVDFLRGRCGAEPLHVHLLADGVRLPHPHHGSHSTCAPHRD